jgi:hypothetical protein
LYGVLDLALLMQKALSQALDTQILDVSPEAGSLDASNYLHNDIVSE